MILRHLLSGCVVVFCLSSLRAENSDTNAGPSPWAVALAFDYSAAARAFEVLQGAHPEDARVAIARASTLLVRQPRTNGNIEEARRILVGVEAAMAGQPGDFERLLASFLVARIDQDHRDPPRPAEARARYERILRDHPGHPVADQAAVQISLLDGWQAPLLPAGEALEAVEKRLPLVRSPEARREIFFILGRLAWQRAQDAPRALAWLQAGRALGYEAPFRNAEVDLMIANFARETGEPGLAVRHYRAFLDGNRRDARRSTVQRYLRELGDPVVAEAAVNTPGGATGDDSSMSAASETGRAAK